MTTREQMDRLIAAHIEAEMAADAAAAVTVYTDDVEHDVVGWPTGPVRGPGAAKDFYDQLIAAFVNQEMVPTRSHYGDDFWFLSYHAMALSDDGRRDTHAHRARSQWWCSTTRRSRDT